MSDALEIPIIASGGVGAVNHFVDGALQGGADALLAASVFHYGEMSVNEVKQAMSKAGIEVRL
jgi:cyclase